MLLVGFHFRFDKSQGSYLAPYWIENTGNSWPNQIDSQFPTHIILPLNSEACRNLEKLRENLQLVFDKTLLLFLKKLSVMVLEDLSYHQQQLFKRLTRVELTKNWISCSEEIDESKLTDIWYIKKKTFWPTVPRSEDDDQEIAATEVAIALKFTTDNDPSSISFEQSAIENSRPPLHLKVGKELTPLYSFLPTRMTAFRFILQADFILVTNRESFEENHSYNKQLLDVATSIIVSMFAELVTFVQTKFGQEQERQSKDIVLNSDDSADNNARLTEICENYNLVINPSAIIDLVPRPDETTSESLKHVARAVCDHLQSSNLFLNVDNEFVPATMLICVDHLPIAVQELVPQELLFQLIGLKLPHSSLHLDKDIIGRFGIVQLSSNILIDCFAEFEKSVVDSLIIEETRKLQIIQLLFVTLFHVSTHESSARQPLSKRSGRPTLNADAPAFTPTQVIIGRTPTSNGKRTLSSEQLKRLQSMRIWPLKEGKQFVSLADRLPIFIAESNNENSNESTTVNMLMQICLNSLPSVRLLHSSIFEEANKELLGFFKANFKPDISDEGILGLTPEKLISTTVYPILHDKKVEPSADLTTKLLALLIAVHLKKPINSLNIYPKGIWVPVEIVKESTSNPMRTITDIAVEYLDQNDNQEIHFGPEFTDCATHQLMTNCSTVMRQTKWKFISSLLTTMLLYPTSIPTVRLDSKKLEVWKEVKNLKEIFAALGVINIWKESKTSIQMLSLVGLIEQLMKKAKGNSSNFSMFVPKLAIYSGNQSSNVNNHMECCKFPVVKVEDKAIRSIMSVCSSVSCLDDANGDDACCLLIMVIDTLASNCQSTPYI
jgi:hypothetical protein